MTLEHEPSARELAKGTLMRSGVWLPREVLPLVEELLVDAVHDGIEFGESIAALPSEGLTPLEHYTEGYLDGLNDRI